MTKFLQSNYLYQKCLPKVYQFIFIKSVVCYFTDKHFSCIKNCGLNSVNLEADKMTQFYNMSLDVQNWSSVLFISGSLQLQHITCFHVKLETKYLMGHCMTSSSYFLANRNLKTSIYLLVLFWKSTAQISIH